MKVFCRSILNRNSYYFFYACFILFSISSCRSIPGSSAFESAAIPLLPVEVLPETEFYKIIEKIQETDEEVINHIYRIIYNTGDLKAVKVKSGNEEAAGLNEQLSLLEGSLELGKNLYFNSEKHYSDPVKIILPENYLQIYISAFLFNRTVIESRRFLKAAEEYFNAEEYFSADEEEVSAGFDESADFFFRELEYKKMKIKASAAEKEAYKMLSAAAVKLDYIEALRKH